MLANITSRDGTDALPMPGKKAAAAALCGTLLVMLPMCTNLEARRASESDLVCELEVGASPLGLCFPFRERRTYWAHHLLLAQVLRQGRDLVNTQS